MRKQEFIYLITALYENSQLFIPQGQNINDWIDRVYEGALKDAEKSKLNENKTSDMEVIRVKDKLPEKMGHFLVYAPKSFPKNCRWLVAEFYIDGDFKGWYGEACEDYLEDVTHYCEIPNEPNNE